MKLFGPLIVLLLHGMHAKASYYLVSSNEPSSYADLVSKYDLVIFTSKDCTACKKLESELERCKLPSSFKVAWVGSTFSRNHRPTNSFAKVKTEERTIKKLTSITPKAVLRGHVFKKGVFPCKELQEAI